ncbi:MAG: T9SS type A sorting domain-containing protein [Flavobacteriaceae bacterium]
MKKIYFFIIIATQLVRAQIAPLDTSFEIGTGLGLVGAVRVTKIQPDGKILIGGNFTQFNGLLKRGIVRLNADGSLDETFNPVILYNNPNFTQAGVYSIAIANEGKILISGGLNSVDGSAVSGLARLNIDGTLDTTFSPLNGFDPYYGDRNRIYVQHDGKIILSGAFSNPVPGGLIRLNTDGSVDNSFNVMTPFNVDSATGTYFKVVSFSFQQIKFQPDNKIVLGGLLNIGKFSSNGTQLGGYQFYASRLNSDGSIDADFFPTNSLSLSSYSQLSGGGSYVKCLELQSDSKIILGGSFTSFNGTAQNSVCRLNSDGSIDNGFLVGLGPSMGISNQIMDVISLSNNKLLVGGDFANFNGVTTSCIARLNSDGNVDTSYISNNLYIGSPQNGQTGYVETISKQSDDKLILGGNFNSYNGLNVRKGIIRLNSESSLAMNNSEANILTLYPNPSNNVLNIILQNNQTVNKVIISDLVGKKIMEMPLTNSQISIESLRDGVYVIEIICDAKSHKTKFVKI